MKLSNTSIRRPVFTTMLMGLFLVFGFISLQKSGVDLLPEVDFPFISVVTTLHGADPEIIESSVTKPIEDVLAGVSSIKKLRSYSSEGLSVVVLEFELEKNLDIAYQEVLSKVNSMTSSLPSEADFPVCEKYNTASMPVISLVVAGDLPIGKLSKIADKTIADRLQQIDGVGQVRLVGRRDRVIWLYLDPAKLEGFSLTTDDVLQALRTQHVQFPAGHIDTGSTEWVIKTRAEFTTTDELKDLVLRESEGYHVKLKDVGVVVDGLEEERSKAFLNEKGALALSIKKQSKANIVTVASKINAEVKKLQKELEPQGIHIEVVQDLSEYILESMHSITFHLIFGGFLAVFVVFLFLQNVRMMLIAATALPLSVISTFIFTYYFRFTINRMTMLALSLAIGILIDDAIVVIENIYRRFSKEKDANKAAEQGTDEIGLAAFAITMTIVAVFVPVAFMKGLIGRYFYQFGLTVSFAVLMSLLVAFTLIPMLTAKFLGNHKQHLAFLRPVERFLHMLDHIYRIGIVKALIYKKTTLLIAVALFVFSLFIGTKVKAEFATATDRSEFSVGVEAPLGTTLENTSQEIEKVRALIARNPWVSYTFTTVGGGDSSKINEGSIYVRMLPKGQRSLSQKEAQQIIRTCVASLSHLKCTVGDVDVMGGGDKNAIIQFELTGPDLSTLNTIATTLIDRMKKSKGYVDIDTSYSAGKPEMVVRINRNAAAACGVSAEAIATTLKTAVAGSAISSFREEGEQYDIIVKANESFRSNPDAIFALSCRNDQGLLVSFRTLVTIEPSKGPVQINRCDRARSITVYANLDPQHKVLGEAIPELTAWANEVLPNSTYKARFAGDAEIMKESFASFIVTLLLAIIFIYMVLASQFESFLQPLVIMVALPFSLIGALLALLLAGATLNIMTVIGIIMLMGLVTKNAILLVDFANTQVKEGIEVSKAIIAAGETRLRPILMTTCAMVFGMLPTALARGADSESKAPMAIAVIGGLLSSLLLTLVVVPVIYCLMHDFRRWLMKKV